MTSITRAARGGAAGRRAPSEAACSDRPRLRAPCLRAAGGGDLGATCEGRPSMHDDAHLVAPSRAISEWISCHLARGARATAASEMLRRLLFNDNVFFAGEGRTVDIVKQIKESCLVCLCDRDRC